MSVENASQSASVHPVAHTPGPWIVKDDDPYDHIFTEETPHRRIANVYGGVKGSNELDLQNKANARLIAAAPDLLAALRKIRAELCRRHSPFVVESDYAYITEAIRKATS